MPIDPLKPEYVWDNYYGVPQSIYYLEDNTREMTEEERADFFGGSESFLPAVCETDCGRDRTVGRGGEGKRMMDQQAAMERMQDLYREKNEHLEKFLELVTPFEFYREIFPVGSFERKGHFEDAKGNGIAVTVPPKAAGIALEIEGGGQGQTLYHHR